MVYDIIVVGSGNGACGFLSYYLNASAHKLITERICSGLPRCCVVTLKSSLSHLRFWRLRFRDALAILRRFFRFAFSATDDAE